MERRRGTAAFAASVVMLGSILTSPASAADSTESSAETPEFLYALSADDIRVRPGGGTSAKVVIMGPTVTRFTNRPYRDSTAVTATEMLRGLGWSPRTTRLTGTAPNAAVAVVGTRTHVVKVRKARILEDRLILRVSGIDGSLVRVRNVGSVFFDSTIPEQTQSKTYNLQGNPPFNLITRLYSDGTVNVTLTLDNMITGMQWLSSAAPSNTVRSSHGMYSAVMTSTVSFVGETVTGRSTIEVTTQSGSGPVTTTFTPTWEFITSVRADR